MNTWTYITNNDNTARYSLGKLGERNLCFIGINPSTARPDDLDRTVTRVERFALDNGYDGWIMLNVYSQRATDPNDMHETLDSIIHNENMEQVGALLASLSSFDICAAWGTEINRRPYLTECLQDLVNIIGTDKRWIHLHHLTKDNHPRHPLYLPARAEISVFNIEEYINS